MRELFYRMRDLHDRFSARLHQDDLHALNARVSWLEERVHDLEEQRRRVKAQAEPVIQEHLENADIADSIADSDPTVTRLRPR